MLPEIIAPTVIEGIEFVKTIIDLNYSAPHDYFITGSTAFGVATVNSDIDIVFVDSSKSFILEKVQQYDVDPSGYNSGLKLCVTLYDREYMINVIFLRPDEYAIWQIATAMFRCLPPVSHKATRVALFESLRASVKLALATRDTHIEDCNYKNFLVTEV